MLIPLYVLADDWAWVRVPVGTFRVAPSQGAEMCVQSMMGTPVKVLRQSGEWYRCKLPAGCEAWCNESAIVRTSTGPMMEWRCDTTRLIVTSLSEAIAYRDSLSAAPRDRVTDLPNGCIVVNARPDSVFAGRHSVRLPDGRTAYVDTAAVMSLEAWRRMPPSIPRVMELAFSMMGVPYLWGGVSTKMNDCSGFARLCYLHGAHILLPRNSYAQSRVGTLIRRTEDLREGDLMFFTNPKTGRINHVGIYVGDGYFIHSSGRVHLSSLDPTSPDYSPKRFSHGRRLFDADGMPMGRFSYLKNNSWYFGQKAVTLPLENGNF